MSTEETKFTEEEELYYVRKNVIDNSPRFGESCPSMLKLATVIKQAAETSSTWPEVLKYINDNGFPSPYTEDPEYYLICKNMTQKQRQAYLSHVYDLVFIEKTFAAAKLHLRAKAALDHIAVSEMTLKDGLAALNSALLRCVAHGLEWVMWIFSTLAWHKPSTDDEIRQFLEWSC